MSLERAIEVARVVGVPLADRRSDPFAWDGKTVAMLRRDWSRDGSWNWRPITASELLHEVAHFQLASSARRGAADFGLGKAPDSTTGAPVLVKDTMPEELLASLLGIVHEHALGLDWQSTFSEHNWTDYEFWEAHGTLVELERRGFIVDGQPTTKVSR